MIVCYVHSATEMSLRDPKVLLHWLQEQIKDYGIKVADLHTSWSNGMALCALIHRYHPELM